MNIHFHCLQFAGHFHFTYQNIIDIHNKILSVWSRKLLTLGWQKGRNDNIC